MEIILLIVGVVVGIVIGYLWAKQSVKPTNELPDFVKADLEKREEELNQYKSRSEDYQSRIQKLSVEHSQSSTEKDFFKDRTENLEIEVKKLRSDLSGEKEINASLSQKQKNLEELLVNQKAELVEVQEKFTKEFENIANKVLDAKAQKFTEQNKEKLGEILKPFQERINDFKEQVEKSSYKSSQERIALSEHIKHLKMLNENMQKETKNLTMALKHDSKSQGNWGEIVLERVLESSGLIKGREYFTQETYREDETDKLLRPDVLVKLPDEKNIIIDSKVSLTAYNNLLSAETEEERASFMKAHLLSIRSHIKGLADKNYQFALGINAPDFVLLFMPIESAFSVAAQADPELFNYAWNQRIVIVSPSTLLATLRTVASVWKHENQTKNAQDIADRASKLYEKFSGFVEDMLKLKKQMDGAEKAYDAAFNKLSTGRGNLINSTQKLIDLGVKVKKEKELPKDLLD